MMKGSVLNLLEYPFILEKGANQNLVNHNKIASKYHDSKKSSTVPSAAGMDEESIFKRINTNGWYCKALKNATSSNYQGGIKSSIKI